MNVLIKLLVCLVTAAIADGVSRYEDSIVCGDDFYTESGFFFSPSYYTPFNQSNETCDWRITADPDERIFLNITDIDIEKASNCSLGYVEVRDGHWSEAPLLGRFCGLGNLEPVSSTSNQMLISYVYNNRSNHRGFFARYESICGHELFTDNETYLASPNYPNPYPLNKKCIWKIEVHKSRKAAIVFDNFDVEHGLNCSSDYLEIRDGLFEDSNLIGIYCNHEIPTEIIASSNYLWIKFISDSSVQRLGFNATIANDDDECASLFHGCAQICINTVGSYKCACNPGYQLHSNGRDCEVACGGTLNATSGTIKSPSYPEIYPLNRTCIWKIPNTPPNYVNLNFSRFDVEEGNLNNSKQCNKDRLDVWNLYGTPVINSTKFHSFCGNVTPPPVISSEWYSKEFEIVFFSDFDIQKSGFAFDYLIARNNCLYNNGNCRDGCFHTEEHPVCICSSGYTLENNGRDCTKEDASNNTYFYEIASVSGNISSQNYPHNYTNNLNSEWLITTIPGNRISLTFLSFATENYYDEVIIYDGISSSAARLGNFSGTVLPSPIYSSDNELLITFTTDHSNVFSGFLAEYSSICGGTFQANTTEQFIYSHPNFPFQDTGSSIVCEWIIEAPSGYNLSMSFAAFLVDRNANPNCPSDKACVYDGRNSSGTNLGCYCEEKQPPPVFTSTQGAFYIYFATDTSIYSGDGFSIVYKALPKE